jgi:hypothetical protein
MQLSPSERGYHIQGFLRRILVIEIEETTVKKSIIIRFIILKRILLINEKQFF